MMKFITARSLARVAALAALLPVALAGQEAVTVSGHVSADNHPVQGATVRVPELSIGSVTDVEGRYSFIIPSSRVRGQSVTLTARHVRYDPQSVQIVLKGGAVQKDFDLVLVSDRRPTAAAESRAVVNPIVEASARATLDSTHFDEVAGPSDVVSSMVGRVVGLTVTSPAALGGAAPVVLRGFHSIVNATQPLFVLDGIPLENSSFRTPGQSSGLGGFDYGSPIQDLNPSDIASVRVLRGPEAAALFGGRAANGVVLISTKNGRGLTGFEVSASQQITFESLIRLPELQNAYGQGLGGRFEFFNGSTGVNDAVAENWGPALNGQPLPQASLTEPRRADVRPWLARPDNVSAFYRTGTTLKTNIAAQGSTARLNFRLAADRSDMRGLTPEATLTRRGIGLTAGEQLSTKLGLTQRVQFSIAQAIGRPGSGFDASNPMADFMRMGRQVDLGALKEHRTDTLDNQISWSYTGHNNPYFTSLVNSNFDERKRWIGGASATYAFSDRLRATVRGARDWYDEVREFDIEPTWMGGFQYYNGRGDFSKGGFQRQAITGSETNGDLFVIGRPALSSGVLTLSAGVGHRENNLHVLTVASDQGRRAAAGTVAASSRVTGDNSTNSFLGAAEIVVGDYASLGVSVRSESYSQLKSGNNSAFYPSVNASFDLLRGRAGQPGGSSLTSARIHGGWGRSGGEISPLVLRNILTAGGAPTAVASPNLRAEITDGVEVGGELTFFRRRLGLDLTLYSERTSDVVLGLPGSGSGSVIATNAASLSNQGLEAQLTLIPLRVGTRAEWSVIAQYAKNSSEVTELAASAGAIALGPSVYGLNLQAVKGVALGALVGSGYQRDPASGALLLRDGHPLPEAKTRVLGAMQPDWTGSVSTTLRYGGLEVAALLDGRMGGRIFSTTNYVGSTTGTLAETAFRPDSGLLISGIDVVTGRANTLHVSTEAYYHSLAAIHEAWIYDASVIKLRDLRLSVAIPLRRFQVFTAQSIRASLIGRNLAMWTKAPNIDPETSLSVSSFQGIEMGQLPTSRSIGFQISITP